MTYRILMAASEAVPYAKVGGLGDVAGALPAYLAGLGHEVKLVLPLYASIDREKYGLRPVLETMGVPMGTGPEWCRVFGCRTPEGFDAYFIEHHDYFSRKGVYDEGGQGYGDNGHRYVFFSRAVLQLCQDLGWSPHVVHCHDWMTGAIPGYLKYHLGSDPVLGYTGSVLTIHNIGLGYQGKYPESAYVYSGLPWTAFNPNQYEDFGWVNLVKGGISQADLLSAVSPTFAREIQEPVGGGGLDAYVRMRYADLHGILNGVDYRDWNPETDKLIPARYSADDLSGKATCKRVLQESFGMDQDSRVPLFGVVSRMNYQKGLDLIPAAVPSMIERGAQFVIVGSGDKALEGTFHELTNRYPGRVGSFMGYDNKRAHLLEAGCDFYLMPSRWEPCGLNQLYSLRYGTVPVVRATGGLDDTVENYRPETGEGTGFKFWATEAAALRDTCHWAMEVFGRHPEHLQQMRLRGMAQRFEWEHAAQRYVQLYEWAIAKRRTWR